MKVYYEAVRMVAVIHDDVLPTLRRVNGNMADQLDRAAESVLNNVAEGWGVGRGKRQQNHFRIALGSGRESMGTLHSAMAKRMLSPQELARSVDRVDHVNAMLFNLVRR